MVSQKNGCARIFVLCCLLSGVVALAQTNTGGFKGVVTDSSGAIMPGVTVTVTNEETGFTRSAVTNDLGIYLVSQLNPGVYTVAAELPGFKRFVQRDIRLHINQVLSLDVTLQVGEVTEQVEVVGQAPLLEASSATIGAVVDQDMVNTLPLDGRHYTQLLLLTSGASSRARGYSHTYLAGTSGLGLAVAGQRARNNRYTLHGIFNQETYLQSAGLAPPIDAIREFKVAYHSSSAEHEALGGSVNVEMKSGTNRFHGNVWHFHRNDNLDANFFFTNRARRRKPEFKQNQFGFTFGGPIKSGHSFFFGTYEGFRQNLGQSRFATVPTPAMKRGDFSGLEPIFDPLTTRANPNDPAKLIRDQFLNNRIPSERINAASKLLMDAFYPDPNLPGLADNFINPKPLLNNRGNYMLRIDTRLGKNTQLWGHYGYAGIDQLNPDVLDRVLSAVESRYQNTGVNLVHTFSPVSILMARLGYNRYERVLTHEKPLTRKEFLQRGGVKMFQEEVPGDALVSVGIEGLNGVSAGARPDIHNTYQVGSTYQRTAGKHSVSLGGDIRRYLRMAEFDVPMNGDMSFDALPTQNPLSPQGTGNGFATFLLGFPSEIRRGFGDARNDNEQWGSYFYIQDDITLTPKLTVNVGLRYQYDSPAIDKLNRLATIDFIPKPGVDPSSPGGMNAVILHGGTNPWTGAPANVRRSIIDPDRNNFAPRFGFAYKLTPNTVVRGGFGIFYDSFRFQEMEDLRSQFPFQSQQNLTVNREPIPTVNWQSEIPFVPGFQIGGWPQNRRNRYGYSQQWNLSVQRQLLQGILFEVGYLGNHNLKQIRYYNFNEAQPGPGNPDLRRPVEFVGATQWGANDTNANYHAMQAKLNKRFSRGLGFMSMWTWSKAIDDQSDINDINIQYGWNRRADRGPAQYDVAHVFVNSFIYEIPIGGGRPVNLSGWQNAILGDWQIQGIVRLESASPFVVRIAGDNAGIGSMASRQRPNLVGDPTSGFTRSVDQWFNKAAFVRPARYTLGNLGRHVLRGDDRRNFDFSIFKTFPVSQFGEAAKVEFRAEFFNLFNHQDFGDPGGIFGTATFGRISSSTPPRDIQFALKVYF